MSPFERFTAAVPGWLFLVGGLALLGITLVTPAWLSVRELAWQRQVMRAQLERLLTQQQRYAAFLAEVESDDPVLLEHLAYTQLRFKPAGKELIETGPNDRRNDRSASVAAWLHEPLPRVGVEIEPLTPINTGLTRLTTGRSRIVLYAAAFACVGAGVVTSLRSPAVKSPRR